jgi:hypothetical protein
MAELSDLSQNSDGPIRGRTGVRITARLARLLRGFDIPLHRPRLILQFGLAGAHLTNPRCDLGVLCVGLAAINFQGG